MIKGVIVGKAVCGATGVKWRVNVNEFDLSAELLFEGVECDEVVALDNEVFA